MLYRKSVSAELLELLNFVMEQEEFAGFNLVGGTSLALQIGHRVSIDIDLFGKSDIDEYTFLEALKSFGTVQVLKKSKNILICSVNGVKIDFVNYNYSLLQPIQNIEKIRLVSLRDIAAMKLNAIAGGGSKKDFIDLFFLLKHFSLSEMLGFYNEKYKDGSEFMVRKSIGYFEDADREETPIIYENITWVEMKKYISQQRF
jgi:hypothetical protein